MRSMRIAALALCLTALIVAPLAADDLQKVLEKHYEAIGGLEKIKSVQTVKVSGKMNMQGLEAPMTFMMKRPNMIRVEFTIQGMTGVQATDGSTSWHIMPFLGKNTAEPMPADEAKALQTQADFDGVLVDWEKKGHQVELVGKEDVEGAACWKLRVVTKDGDEQFHYIDAEHHLTLQVTGKRKVQGTEVETVTTFGDFKEVNGMMTPHVMEALVKGTPFKQAFVFEKIEHDLELDPDVFVMPAAAPAPPPPPGAEPAAAETGAPPPPPPPPPPAV